jgi:hypothetical protein
MELGDPVMPLEHESAHDFTKRLQEIFEQNLSHAHKLRREVEEPES